MQKNKLAVILLCLFLLIGSFQTAEPAEASNGSVTITASNLNVRQGPGLSYPVVGKANKGEKYSFIKQQGDWIQIGLSGGRQGWVAEWFIKKENSSDAAAASVTDGAIGTATVNLNVRASPSLNGRVAGKLAKGAKVRIQSQENGWAVIDYNGQAAYVSSQYLSFTASPQPSGTKPAKRVPSGSEATVTASTLYIRDKANLNGKIVGQITRGQRFRILEEKDNWLKIEYKPGRTGWAAGWFFEKKASSPSPASGSVKNQTVTILHNGTNIRKGPGVHTGVVQRAGQGDTFKVKGLSGEWYQVALANGRTGYIAGWLVSLNGSQAVQIQKPGAGIHIKNKTVVIDPGHGGRDGGTVGTRGTLEKHLNLKTARLLSDKLKASGTNVIMTRSNDTYVSLSSRVSISHYHNADAFISIHYDSIADRSVNGMTAYYYHPSHKRLSTEIHWAVSSRTSLRDRGVRQGDYHVIRENRQPSVLLELGYLSNPAEEMLVSTAHYQEAVAGGIFEGLARYFKRNGQ